MATRKLNLKLIDDFINQVTEDVFDLKDKVILHAHGRLVQATPVDLGQARAGWNFSVNELDFSTPSKPAKGTKLSPPPDPMPKSKSLKDIYHLSNFVTHIIYLNEGTSINAPTNFFEIEVAQAIKDVGL